MGLGGKNFVKNLSIAVLAIFLLTGCLAYFKTIAVDDLPYIKEMPPTKNKAIEDVDYSRMTWQEAMVFVKTPAQAQHYLNSHFSYDIKEASSGFNMIFFNIGTKGETFKYNHTRRKGICIDYATVAAALLSDDGYPPLILCLKRIANGRKYAHAVFLYRTGQGFGALSTLPIEPRYKTVEELVIDYFDYPSYDYYCIVNLDEQYKNREWVDGDVDSQIPRVDKWIKVKRKN